VTKLRVAVVGVGHLGRHHVRLLGGMADVDLVAAVDLVTDRAATAVQGTGARVLGDYQALFGAVDAVTLAVPTVDHLRIAEAFLGRGIHVLVEKPMTSSVEEADRLIHVAGQSGACLAVGHTERFNPALQAALGVIDRPRFIEIHRLSGFPDRSLDIDVIFDVMIHDLDMLLAIDPSGVTGVEAVGVTVLTSRIDIANARVKFASGCIANLTASRISRDKVRKMRCFQQDMYVSVDYQEQDLEVWRLRRGTGVGKPMIEGGRVPVARDEPLRLELADFVAAVRDRRPPQVTGDGGRLALALATEVAESIERTGAAAGVH
jgi:predicted dehydrogenase